MRRIAPRWATPYLLLLIAPPSSAAAQDAVVSRNVNLRHDPSTNQPAIRLMLPGAELFVLDGQARTNGYYHVRAMDGAEGWAGPDQTGR